MDVAPGDYEPETAMICVLTRFRLRRPWHLLQTYLSYRWLRRRMRGPGSEGLLHAGFLVEGPTTAYSLSIWADEEAIPRFGTAVQEHTPVAQGVFGRLRQHHDRPELWSTKWRLHRVSNNLNWEGFGRG